MITSYDWLIGQFGSNDFLVGTTVPFLLGALAYMFRSFFFGLWNHLLRMFTISVQMNSDQSYYSIVCEHIYAKHLNKMFQRNATLTYKSASDDSLAPDQQEDTLTQTPGYGRHFAIIYGWPAILSRSIDPSQSRDFKEHFLLRIITPFPNRVLAKLVKEMQAVVETETNDEMVRIYKLGPYDGLVEVAKKPRRAFSTMHFKKDLENEIKTHFDQFFAKREEYEAIGKPWHTGILFYGRPGSGKTSMTHIIASYLRRNIVYHSGGNVMQLSAHTDWKRCVLALEDVDASDVKSNTSDRDSNPAAIADMSPTNMADFLNFLDGFLSPHGMIVIATTNHVEKLDPAFFRKGRFDLMINMDEYSLQGDEEDE